MDTLDEGDEKSDKKNIRMWIPHQVAISAGHVEGFSSGGRRGLSENAMNKGDAGTDWINEKLDNDLLMLILKRIQDSEDGAAWPIVCRRWLQLEGRLRKSVKLLQVKAIKRLLSRFTNIEVLDLSCCHNLTDDMLSPFLGRYGKSLLRLNLSGCKGVTNLSLARILEHCTRIVELRALRCTSIADRGLSAVYYCHDLQVLSLAYCRGLTDQGLRYIADGSKMLMDLNLRWCKGITDVGIQLLAQGCTSLRSLDISYTEVTNGAMPALAGLKNLRTLLMVCCENVNDDGIGRLGHGCPVLEKLDISGCVGIGDRGISALADSAVPLQQLFARSTAMGDDALAKVSNFERLTVLRLERCAVTVLSLAAIGSRCQGLRELGLWKCMGVTDVGVISVLSGCTQLLRLDLTCCSDITDYTLVAIGAFCKGLVALEMESCGLISENGLLEMSNECTALEEVDLSECNVVDGGARMVARCRELRKLRMGLCAKLTDSGLGPFGACTSLREVEFYRLPSVGDMGIAAIMLGTHLLTHLNLSYCAAITDVALQAIATCRLLVNLELRGCINVTSEGLAMLASGCKQLEELDLKRCVGIGNSGIVAIAEGCPRLRQLNLSYCQTGDEGLMSLTQLSLLENMKLIHLPNVSVACLVHVLLRCHQLKKLKLLTTYRAGIPKAVIEHLESSFCKLRWMDKPEKPPLSL